MEIEQDEIISILAKRFERKHLSILLFFSINTIAAFMPENLEITNELLYNIGMLISCILLIKLFILFIQGIKDFIKNGKTSILKKKLNNETNVLLNEKISPKQWIKYSWIILLIILFVKPHNNSNINVEQTNTQVSKQTEQSAQTKPKHVKTKQVDEDLTWFAQYACEKEIKARAIYPPSTKVHFRRDNYIKGNSYTLYGTVDSQNAFGAMIRQNFACEAIIDKPNDKYWINDLNIE